MEIRTLIKELERQKETSLARKTKNPDEQIRLEGFGGKLLNTPDKEFEQMIAQEG